MKSVLDIGNLPLTFLHSLEIDAAFMCNEYIDVGRLHIVMIMMLLETF